MAQVPCTLCNGILDDECTECFGRGVMEDRQKVPYERSAREWWGYDLPGEEWRPMPGFERYHISNMGRVVNVESGNLMKLNTNNSGYYVFRTNYKSGDVGATMHRLVAELFLPDYDPKFKVEFIDEDKSNMRVSNLRMGTVPVRGKGKNRVVG